MIGRKDNNLQRNNYKMNIIWAATPKADSQIQKTDKNWLTIANLPYTRGMAERSQKIYNWNNRTIFKSNPRLQRHLMKEKPLLKENMTKNCIYNIPCSCGTSEVGLTSIQNYNRHLRKACSTQWTYYGKKNKEVSQKKTTYNNIQV